MINNSTFLRVYFCFVFVVPQGPRARETGKYYGKGAYSKHVDRHRQNIDSTAEAVMSPTPPAEENFEVMIPIGFSTAEAIATTATPSVGEKVIVANHSGSTTAKATTSATTPSARSPASEAVMGSALRTYSLKVRFIPVGWYVQIKRPLLYAFHTRTHLSHKQAGFVAFPPNLPSSLLPSPPFEYVYVGPGHS